MKKILIIFLAWFIFLNLLNFISLKFLFDKTSYELPKNISLNYRHITVPWLNFDGRNYLEIVNKGYEPGYKTDLHVFFPIYPSLIRIISLNLLLNPVLVGLGISFLAFLSSLFVFYKLLKEDRVNEKNIKKILLLLIIFPTSFYFLAFYTESLFLLLVLLVFYFLNRKEFGRASLLAVLATATRISGLALLPAIFWESYQAYKKNKKFPWSTLSTPLGFVIFSIYLQLTTNDGSAFVSQQKNWNKPIGILGPWFALRDGFLKFLYGSVTTMSDFFGHSMEVIEFVSAVFLILLIIFSYKKIKFSYWLYLFFSALLIFFSGVLSSVHRYMLVMFPIYIFIGSLPKRYYFVFCLIFLILLIYLSALFLRGYWVA